MLSLIGLTLWTSFAGESVQGKGSGSSSASSKDNSRKSAKSAKPQGVLDDVDIAYGSDPIQKLNVYYKPGLAKAPVVLFIHGGGWISGKKEDIMSFVDFFSGQGCIVVSPGYRLASNGKNEFPACVQDVACAVVWTKKNIAKYGGDEEKLIISGHSAGAHIAAMVAYNPEGDWLKGCPASDQDLKVAGFIGSSGPYDFDYVNPARGEPKILLGGRGAHGKWEYAEPINYVSKGDPPGLIITGENDGFLNVANPKTGRKTTNSDMMAGALAAVGVDHQLVVMPGWNHGAINENLMGSSELQATMAAFIKKTVANPRSR